MGPLFKPSDKDFFVVTNINAPNPNFKNQNKTNNSIQFIGSQWDNLRMVEPEGTQEMLDAKGKMVLAFEQTNPNRPGQLFLDSEIVSKVGYKAPEGDASAIFIANSDPAFYLPKTYSGGNNTSASTSTKVNLIGTGWEKGSITNSQFKNAVDEFKSSIEKGSNKVALDVFINKTSTGERVEIFVQKTIAVENGATALQGNYNTSGEYSIFEALGDFMQFQNDQGQNISLSDTFKNITGDTEAILEAGPGGGGAVAFGNSDANKVKGSAKGDAVNAGAGNDILDGGGGADRLQGGEGDDTIKGGSDGAKQITENGNTIQLQVQEWGDRAVFKGKKADYTITSNSDGTFTVTDNVGTDGTDTLEGIEILEFADSEELLVTETESFSTQDFATGKTIQEEFSKGTEFDDVIIGGTGKSIIKGKAGNDVIKGDGVLTSGSKDIIEGGAGNDFIDGQARGQGVMPWENDNIAEYMAAARRFTVEKLTYTNSYSRKDADGNTITDKTDKEYLDSLISSLNMNANAIGALSAGTSQKPTEYFVVTDSVSDANGGLGTDILVNIDEIFFDDKGMRLSLFKDVWGGRIEGTDFADTITGEGVDEEIDSGDGDDRVSGGAGSDRAVLGKGNDFFDGGSNKKDFNSTDYLKGIGFNLDADPNALGSFNPDEFMNMMDVGPVGSGMPMNDPMAGGSGFNDPMGGGFNDAGGMGGNYQDMGGGGNNVSMPGGNSAAMPGGDMGHGHGGGPSGDTAVYQGDYARFTVKTYAGNSSELATIISQNFGDLVNDSSKWVESKSYTVVSDTNTGSKGLGKDLLVNV